VTDAGRGRDGGLHGPGWTIPYEVVGAGYPPLADADGLPLGLDLIGLPGEDEMLLKAASIVMGEG